MKIEYEATFIDINKDEMRKKFKDAGAKLIRPEFLQKRRNFYLPNKKRHAWLRVRDEGDKITMSLKIINGDKIEDQKETCFTINNFNEGIEFLAILGCEQKGYQESKRELWKLDGVDITIDEWPFLEPFIEVEGKSEQEVKKVCTKVGLNYNKALFCAVGRLYENKYNIPSNKINTIPNIIFDMQNPFIK